MALGLYDGRLKWVFETDKPIFTSPVICGDNIVFGCVDNCVYSISTAGTLLWRYSSSGHIFSSPTCKYLDGSPFVLFGSNDGFIYCLDNQGQLLWKHELGSAIVASPTLVDSSCGKLVTRKRKVDFEYDQFNGKIRLNSVTSPCSTFNHIETREHDQEIGADLQTVNGTSSFEYERTDCIRFDESHNQKCKDNGTSDAFVISIDTKGKMVVIDLLSGEPTQIEKGFVQCDGEVFSSPVVVGDRIVFGCRDNNVYCLRFG